MKGFETVVGCKGFDKGGYVDGGVGEAVAEGVELLGLDEGFIALDVDDDIVGCGLFGVGFVYSVGAALVGCAGHDGFAAEGLDGGEDALVVGGDDDIVEDVFNLAVYALDDGLASEEGEGLGGETCGGVTGWDDAYVFHDGAGVKGLMIVMGEGSVGMDAEFGKFGDRTERQWILEELRVGFCVVGVGAVDDIFGAGEGVEGIVAGTVVGRYGEGVCFEDSYLRVVVDFAHHLAVYGE